MRYPHENAPAGRDARTEAHKQTDSRDCAASLHEAQIAKRLASAKARAALLAGSVIESEDDHGRTVYLLTRWAYTREFSSLPDLCAVLDRMEGQR